MSAVPVYQDRYEVERELGRGGMSVVYLARDRQLLSKRVVVKELLGELSGDAWVRKKLMQEMEALARIDHPGVVGVLDTGSTPEGNQYLVMQYVEGDTLRNALEPGGMDLARAANLIRQIAHGLQAAHDKGIWHRDLKPENVMLQKLSETEERAILIDFGIAGIKDSVFGGEKTRVAGTTTYMAPEQFAGAPVAASDTYALGVVAYEMITGRKPFSPDSFTHLISETHPVAPRALRKDLPERAERAILRAISFSPDSRHARVCEFGEELFQAVIPAGAARKPHAADGPEMAHILFMDLVSFSLLTMDQQKEYIEELQRIVRELPRFRAAEASCDLICLPRGDGMALVFFEDPTAPAQCALEVAAALKTHPHLKLRIGIHTGPVYRVADVNANADVAGGGINMAQRVMDAGDPGHILVSSTTADVLLQMRAWVSSLTDLGEHTVKHGAKIHLYNLTTTDSGNRNVPQRLRKSKQPGRRSLIIAGAIALALLAALAAAGWWYSRPVLQLEYSIVLQKYRDEKPYEDPRRLGHEILLERDYRIAFAITSPQPGYLYILNEGPEPATGRLTFNLLVPKPEGDAAVQASALTRIPREGYMSFDAARGKETLYLIWARQPVAEMERLKTLPVVHSTVVVADAAEMKRIHEFLDPRVGKVEVIKDDQAKQTDLRIRDGVLVHAISLEHQ